MCPMPRLYKAAHFSAFALIGLPAFAPVDVGDHAAAKDLHWSPSGAVLAQASGLAPSPNSGETLRIDSVAPEPAVPLNLWLDLRSVPATRIIEITVFLAKRAGYPAEIFHDRNVTAHISLLPGLQLESGSLTWTGELRGNQVAQFVARVVVPHDIEGLIEVSVTGHAAGGRVDADSERFRISARGDRIEVRPDTGEVISPLRPGEAIRN